MAIQWRDWGNWQNIRGSTAASDIPGALGPTQSVGGSVAFINGLYAQNGGMLSVNETHRNNFQRGFRGRVPSTEENVVGVQVHAMTTPIPPRSTYPHHTNGYTANATRTWSLYTSFSNQETDNPNKITDWAASNIIYLQQVNTFSQAVGFWNNPNVPWNSPNPGSRSWFDNGGIVNVPANRQNWTWFRGILATQFGEAVQNVPTYIRRDHFLPPEYRPMATMLNNQWHSLNRENGFLQSRNNSGNWSNLPLLQHPNAPNMNETNNTNAQTPFPTEASSQSRGGSGTVWRQQSLIGSE